MRSRVVYVATGRVGYTREAIRASVESRVFLGAFASDRETRGSGACVSEQDVNLVPGKSHYAASYVRGARLFSYAHQMNAVLGFEPRSVVEIGPGPGVVTAALRTVGVGVTTVDVQRELKPDVVASVTDLPFEDDAFDVSMCCQVLEHLPFDEFVPALRELDRVSREAVVISVPDSTPHYEVRVQVPKLRDVHWTGTRQWYRGDSYKRDRLELDGHYWEIGYPETTLGDVKAAFERAGVPLRQTWRFVDNVYHRFFVAGGDGGGRPPRGA